MLSTTKSIQLTEESVSILVRVSKYGLSKSHRLDDLNHDYETNLNALKWISKEKGIVKVPINVAVDHVVKTYNQD